MLNSEYVNDRREIYQLQVMNRTFVNPKWVASEKETIYID